MARTRFPVLAILPPAPQHAALVRAAIAVGKDVYCEWPLTTTVADTEDLLDRAEKAGVRHVVGLQRVRRADLYRRRQDASVDRSNFERGICR